jgi:hypothetical protein
MNSQIVEIWKYFSLYKVKYLTIGGFAVNRPKDLLDIEELEKLNRDL